MGTSNYIRQFKEWFESRNLREKFLVCFFSWALLYAIFAIIFFRPLDIEKTKLAEKIKKSNDQITSWKAQLKFIKDIPNTALYKEWSARHEKYLSLKKYYKNLLGDQGDEKWDAILQTVLGDYPNITVDSIHHSPESAYQTGKVDSKPDAIYQQQLRLSVIGEYSDIVGYLTYLEKTLPNIYWNTLTYETMEYPLAQVEMEFSVIYEKPAR